MRRLALVLALLPLAVQAEQCTVTDGDSLRCSQSGRVRLHGIYAAEQNEPGGAEATQRMRDLVRGGSVTILPRGHDRYGRTLADVYVNGRKIEQSDIGPRAGRGSKR